MKIAYIVPALIRTAEDVLRVLDQLLVKERIKAVTDHINIVPIVVWDGIDRRYEHICKLIAKQWQLSISPSQIVRCGNMNPDGIRTPTEYVIKNLPVSVDLVIRCIQDTHVTEPKVLVDQLLGLPSLDENWMAGKLETGTKPGDVMATNRFLLELGLPTQKSLFHVQGAFIVAPHQVWQRYYSRLPLQLRHHYDDTVMSNWIIYDGGRLIDIGSPFVHRHESCPKCTESLLVRHLNEINDFYPNSDKSGFVKEVLQRLQEMDIP